MMYLADACEFRVVDHAIVPPASHTNHRMRMGFRRMPILACFVFREEGAVSTKIRFYKHRSAHDDDVIP